MAAKLRNHPTRQYSGILDVRIHEDVSHHEFKIQTDGNEQLRYRFGQTLPAGQDRARRVGGSRVCAWNHKRPFRIKSEVFERDAMKLAAGWFLGYRLDRPGKEETEDAIELFTRH
jgi:hypothetical protein